jgi:hypothetical protein
MKINDEYFTLAIVFGKTPYNDRLRCTGPIQVHHLLVRILLFYHEFGILETLIWDNSFAKVSSTVGHLSCPILMVNRLSSPTGLLNHYTG